MNRGAEHLLHWNEVVKEKRENQLIENKLITEFEANKSKLSNGSRRMIAAHTGLRSARCCSYTSLCTSQSTRNTGPAEQRAPIRAKLDVFLQQKCEEQKATMRNEIRIEDFSKKVILPNCIFFQTHALTAQTSPENKYKAHRTRTGANNENRKNVLLGEDVVTRGERWIQSKKDKLAELQKKLNKNSYKECTFFPTFYTKTKRLF